MITKDKYVAVSKWAATGLATQSAVGMIIAAVPFLGLPPFKQILSALIGRFVGSLVNLTEFGAFFVYTDFRVTRQGREFWDAAVKGYALQQTGTPKEKADAKADLHAKFSTLVRFNT